MSKMDMRFQERVNHPFAFHLDGEVFFGNNFSVLGVGVRAKPKKIGEFCFYKGQQIKDAVMEIEGETIRISKLRVCWLEHSGIDRIYGLEFESILPQEQQKVVKVYKAVKEKHSSDILI